MASTELAIRWPLTWTMNFEKSCLTCRETWRMHHRCPALGGCWNCC